MTFDVLCVWSFCWLPLHANRPSASAVFLVAKGSRVGTGDGVAAMIDVAAKAATTDGHRIQLPVQQFRAIASIGFDCPPLRAENCRHSGSCRSSISRRNISIDLRRLPMQSSLKCRSTVPNRFLPMSHVPVDILGHLRRQRPKIGDEAAHMLELIGGKQATTTKEDIPESCQGDHAHQHVA